MKNAPSTAAMITRNSSVSVAVVMLYDAVSKRETRTEDAEINKDGSARP